MTTDDLAPDDPLIERVIAGKFRLKGRIGSGSSGAVFLADQIALGRTVAVKILRPDLAGDDRFIKRFHDEALAASSLNHPNTVSVIDYGQTEDGLLYLVMEYLRGCTLTELLHQEFPLETPRVVDLVTQILSGVEEAHEAGVVHADLKLDNVVVEHRRGGWDLVKVVDFGIAHLLGRPRDESEKDVICGTPEYMAPEIIRGAEPTFASDLYAVGIIVYELLCGHTPFAGGESLDVLTAHIKRAPTAPHVVRPDLAISRALEDAALRALAKSPADRFPSATAFRDELSQVLGRRPSERDEVLCPACGALSAASFKFCPECGRARLARAPTGEPTGVDRADTLDAAPAGAAAASGDDPPAGDILPLPFVGRDVERERVAGRAIDGPAGLLRIVGPPGAGRSRLLGEVFDRVAARSPDTMIYVAEPDPSGLASPYYPVRALVASALDLPPFCPYEALVDAVEALGLTSREVPGVAELLGHEGDLGHLDPPARRRELHASTLRVLLAAGRQRPTLIAFEDVDRYDDPTRALLLELAARAGEGDLRVVATHTDTFAEAWPKSAAELVLGPLEVAAVAAVADHMRRHSESPVPAGEELATITGGDPSHLHQLIRYILEGGSADAPPPSPADLIAARLELLPRRAVLVAQAAAAFGIEVPREHLAESLGESVTTDDLERALSVLEVRGFVEQDEVVRFERALVRDVVYDTTPADVRRSLHGAVLEVLRDSVADPAVLGHHSELAGRLREAAELMSRAGDNAGRKLDDAGAGRLYQRALSAARRLMLADVASHNRMLFVATSVKLADALRVAGEPALARGVVDEAIDHSRDAPALRAPLLRATAHIQAAEQQLELAVNTVRQAIGIAITTGQRELLAELYLDISTFHVRRGHTGTAISELEEGIDLVTVGEGAAATDAPAILWRLLLRLGKLHAAREQREQALALALGAEKQAERVDSQHGTAHIQAMLAAQYEALGDPESAERYRSRAIEAMRTLGDRRGTAELLLSGAQLTRNVARIDPASMREARQLALEIGWAEGVARARDDLMPETG